MSVRVDRRQIAEKRLVQLEVWHYEKVLELAELEAVREIVTDNTALAEEADKCIAEEQLNIKQLEARMDAVRKQIADITTS